jgi:hypothetical protein
MEFVDSNSRISLSSSSEGQEGARDGAAGGLGGPMGGLGGLTGERIQLMTSDSEEVTSTIGQMLYSIVNRVTPRALMLYALWATSPDQPVSWPGSVYP